MRLEQIAQGFVGGLPEEVTERVAGILRECRAVNLKGRPKELVFPGSTKLTWTLDYIEDLHVAGRPAVLWSRFNAPLYWFFQELEKNGRKPILLIGNLTSVEKQAAIEGFQSGRYDVLLGQVKMAEGFTLVRSSDVIMFGRDWSPATNVQAEDRCHRIGQLGTVNVEIPVVLETCETYLEKRLAAKQSSADAILAVRTMRELKDLVG
jgi:SNF2 family DNA or RNA helicase